MENIQVKTNWDKCLISPSKYLYWPAKFPIFSLVATKRRGEGRERAKRVAGQSLIPAGWTADSISLSLEERNIHNSLSERPFSSYMQIPDPKGEVVRKSKKKTPLQEFLILMGSRKDGRSRKPNGNSFIIPGEQTRNYLFLPYWLRCLSYFVFRKCCSVFLYRVFFNQPGRICFAIFIFS